MSFKIVPDYSFYININDSEDRYLLDPRYDFIRLFPALGYGILNIITENGVNRMYTDEEHCRKIAERGIPLVELNRIVESENETIREIIANNLNDDWLRD